jgi:flagellar basal-body rod protein FlgC
MAFLDSLNISGSGLTAQKLRMQVVAQNLANAQTTRTENGEPYRRKLVVLSERNDPAAFSNTLNASIGSGESLKGVEATAILDDADDFKLEYDPAHPDADANGYVRLPNVDTVEEMVDIMSASRLYEANVTAFNAMKEMAAKALEIGK